MHFDKLECPQSRWLPVGQRGSKQQSTMLTTCPSWKTLWTTSAGMEAVSDSGLAGHLLAIKRDYECLIRLVEKSELQKCNIITAYQDFTSTDFAQDSWNIKQYVTKRLESNADFITIATLSRDDISPGQYNFLQRCQATSASVERSFFMLKKFLPKDRPFRDDNVGK